MAKIYIATHGKKSNEPNPRLTDEGTLEVEKLRPLLPKTPSSVICGTARRHIDTANALDVRVNRFTSTVGDADSMVKLEDAKVIVLADGSLVDPKIYTTLEDNAIAAQVLIASLPDQSVVCSGRPLMIMLGVADAQSAKVYCVEVAKNKIDTITQL